ncbi:hypothetical protein [Streptomyces vinaceus]
MDGSTMQVTTVCGATAAGHGSERSLFWSMRTVAWWAAVGSGVGVACE